MANYVNLQAAIDAGITNMTVTRNNSKNDDGTDTIASGITWFYFNSIQVTNLYVSGNSWVGFGASSEQLKVNRRDAAVWYEYTETGTIGTYRFLKLRWVGYSAYSATSDANLQQYDVFLLDNGQIYLNWFDVPTSSFDGTNALVCGSVTTFSATAGTACEYTFTPSNAATGTGWSVASGRPNLIVNHKTSGSAIFTATGITRTVAASSISWTESKPTGTTLAVSVSTDGTNYSAVTNGNALLAAGTVLNNATIYVKVEMATTDATVTPTLSNLAISLQSAEDTYSIVLEMQPLERFESAAGNIAVAYDGLGILAGQGGPVPAFEQSFSPVDLIPKPDQNDQEHVSVSMSAIGNLMRVYYTDTKEEEHIEVTMSATGKLTNVNDI